MIPRAAPPVPVECLLGGFACGARLGFLRRMACREQGIAGRALRQEFGLARVTLHHQLGLMRAVARHRVGLARIVTRHQLRQLLLVLGAHRRHAAGGLLAHAGLARDGLLRLQTGFRGHRRDLLRMPRLGRGQHLLAVREQRARARPANPASGSAPRPVARRADAVRPDRATGGAVAWPGASRIHAARRARRSCSARPPLHGRQLAHCLLVGGACPLQRLLGLAQTLPHFRSRALRRRARPAISACDSLAQRLEPLGGGPAFGFELRRRGYAAHAPAVRALAARSRSSSSAADLRSVASCSVTERRSRSRSARSAFPAAVGSLELRFECAQPFGLALQVQFDIAQAVSQIRQRRRREHGRRLVAHPARH